MKPSAVFAGLLSLMTVASLSETGLAAPRFESGKLVDAVDSEPVAQAALVADALRSVAEPDCDDTLDVEVSVGNGKAHINARASTLISYDYRANLKLIAGKFAAGTLMNNPAMIIEGGVTAVVDLLFSLITVGKETGPTPEEIFRQNVESKLATMGQQLSNIQTVLGLVVQTTTRIELEVKDQAVSRLFLKLCHASLRAKAAAWMQLFVRACMKYMLQKRTNHFNACVVSFRGRLLCDPSPCVHW